MRKRMLLFLILITITIININVFAADLNLKPTILYGNIKEITPNAIDVCGGYPSHDMVSKGWGTVYLGTYPNTSNRILYMAPCWQCSRCNYVMVTEGDPLLGQNIGKYATYPYSYPINGYGCIMWVNSYSYCNSTKLQYYSFRKAN